MAKSVADLVDEKRAELGVSPGEWVMGLERDGLPEGALDRPIKVF